MYEKIFLIYTLSLFVMVWFITINSVENLYVCENNNQYLAM